jgi:hypothetical protein
MFGYSYVPSSGQWFHFQKNLRNSITNVLVVYTLRFSRCARNRLAYFTYQLLAGFVHADNRASWIVGQFVHSKHIFHGGYECCTLLRGDFPVLPDVRLKFVFFRMRCTVI